MPRKDRPRKGPVTPAKMSAIGRANSASSPWRKTPISKRSAECHEYFHALAEAGDTRRVPRPELD